MEMIEEFLKKESTGGLLLICATILALLLSNTGMAPLYETFLHIPVEIRVGALHIDKSLYHWVNDGLMAIFFLLIGLEVKREILEGHLSSVKQVILPTNQMEVMMATNIWNPLGIRTNPFFQEALDISEF